MFDLTDIFQGTELIKFQPEPGSVCIDREIISQTDKILNDEVGASVDVKVRAFACFAQLIDAIVLHERVYFRDSLSKSFTVDEHLSTLIVPLPGYEEFHSKAAKLITDSETQKENSFDKDFLVSFVAGIPYVPSPYRTELARRMIQQRKEDYYRNFALGIMDLISEHASEKITVINQLLGETRFKIDVPLVFNHVFFKVNKHFKSNKLQNLRDIFNAAIEFRESKSATAFRKMCSEFDLAARVGDSDALYRIREELMGVTEYLGRQINQPKIEINIEFPPSISINPFQLWRVFDLKRKYHLLFIKELYNTAIKSEGILKQFYSAL